MEPFLGEIRLFGGSYAPLGWNYCDGTLLDISTNDTLYALIGTAFGGDGVRTFAVPDLRGRVPVHQGSTPSTGTYTIGEVGGVEQVTLLTTQMPAHTHVLNASNVKGTTSDPTGAVFAQALDTCKLYVSGTPADTALSSALVSASTGGSMPHENRQPYVAINYIIALAGIFPSQN